MGRGIAFFWSILLAVSAVFVYEPVLAYGISQHVTAPVPQCRVNVNGNGVYISAWYDYTSETTPRCAVADTEVIAYLKSKYDQSGASCGWGPWGTNTSTFFVDDGGNYVKRDLCSATGTYSDTKWGRQVDTQTYQRQNCGPQSKEINGQCICDPGFSEDAKGECVPYQCPNAGSIIPGSEGHTFSLPEGSPGGTTACVSGCVVTGSLAVAYTDSTGTKHSEIAGPMRATGQQCNPTGQGGNLPSLGAANPGDSAASAPSRCPVGQCPGQVNGTNVCVACSSSTSSNVTSTGSQSSGGSITTTECTGGNCVTKTGTIDAAGNVTYNNYSSGSGSSATNTGSGSGAGQQSQDQQDFCASHPDSMICKSSGWGGSCGSWSCSGDAVQCQIAKMQADIWCGTQLPEGAQDKYNALTGEGAASAAFGDSMALELPKAEAAQCAVQDIQLTFIGGVPLVVPLSNMCEYLGYIHSIVVAFGILMWVFIVFRGK